MNYNKEKHTSSNINVKPEPYLIQPIIHEHRRNSFTQIIPSSTGHNLLSQRVENNEIDPNVKNMCQDSRTIDEKADAKQTSRSIMQNTMDSVACKTVSSGRNKNQVPRLSRNARLNQQISNRQENIEKPHCEKIPYRLQNDHQRVPVSCVSERDENMNNLQGHKGCYKDILILHSEKDTEKAYNFLQHLLILGIPKLTVDIFEDINIGMSEMKCISLLLRQYRTVVLFITNNFAEDTVRRYQAEVLQRQIQDSKAPDPRVVPVWIDEETRKSVLEWTPIKGIRYYPLREKERISSQQMTSLVERARERRDVQLNENLY